jgi:hypothetical protein
MASLDENLRHPNEDIQINAASAFSLFSRHCWPQKLPASVADLLPKYFILCLIILFRYMKDVNGDPNPATRRGYALAIASFPEPLLLDKIDLVLTSLFQAAKIPVFSQILLKIFSLILKNVTQKHEEMQ